MMALENSYSFTYEKWRTENLSIADNKFPLKPAYVSLNANIFKG